MSHKNTHRKSVYKHKRYWYHVSTTLKDKYVHLIPLKDGVNRSGDEPNGRRICVSPTIEQCITAIPYILSTKLNIYRTKKRLIANHPQDIFDSNVTQEGWLQKPTSFVKVGMLKFQDVEKALGVEHVISEAASLSEPRVSGRVLKWWKKAKIKRLIKKA